MGSKLGRLWATTKERKDRIAVLSLGILAYSYYYVFFWGAAYTVAALWTKLFEAL
jgi:hypothetical protein